VQTCDVPAPASYGDKTGNCDRPKGHPIRTGTRGPTEPDDLNLLHQADLGSTCVIRWSDEDADGRNEIRVSADHVETVRILTREGE
jgi:hypothetical protein